MSDKNKKDKDEEADWMIVASKSRIGHYYRFNKTTGERHWCSKSGTDIKTETPATPITNCSLKTPAQDRLKRLQGNLKTTREKNNENKRREEAQADLEKRISARNKIFGKHRYSMPTATCSLSQAESTSQDSTTKRKRNTNKNESKKDPTNVKNKPLLETSFKPADKQSDSVRGMQKNRKRTAIHTESNEAISPAKIKKSESLTNSVTTETKSAAAICASICNKALQLFRKKLFPKSKTKVETKTLEDKKDKEINVPKENSDIANTKAGESLISASYNKDVSKSTDSTCSERPNKRLQLANAKSSETLLSTKRASKGSFAYTGGADNSLQLVNSKSSESLISTSHTRDLPSSASFGKAKKRLQLANAKSNEPLLSTKDVSKSSLAPVGKANERLHRLRQSLRQQTSLMGANLSAQSENSNAQSVSKDNEIEQMDWEPTENTIGEFNININVTCPQVKPETLESIEKQRIDEDIRETQKILNKNLQRLVTENNFGNGIENAWLNDHYYFVVDTNVLMNRLTFVDDTTKMKLCNTAGTVIYVPYIVLQELDKLKQFGRTESAKTTATRAIRYLNVKFEERNKHFQAQSVVADGRHLIHRSSPDDGIINCCLQLREHIDNFLLLTEDINLQNKAMASDILTASRSSLISAHPETNIKS